MRDVPGCETIVTLVTSYTRTEKYIPLVRNLLDTFWTGRQRRYFLTDGASQTGDDILSFPGLVWVDLLCAGLAEIKLRQPGTKYVFHMLEDHCPLRHCDDDRLKRVFDTAIRNELDAVSFPTYHWPWNETDATIFPDGLVRTWRRKEIFEIDGELLAVVPRDFFRYFQVQPTLWRLDYLNAACAFARTQSINDAWAFEAMRWEEAGRHYISRYDWPSVHHGFLAQGRLNPEAIIFMDRKLAAQPFHALVRDAIGVDSPILFDAAQMLRRAKRSIRNKLSDAKRLAMMKVGQSAVTRSE